MKNFFNKQVANQYDKNNTGMAPMSENMHFLIGLILKELPEDARVLCIGVGTGTEIFALAKEHPKWTFVGVDPSADMLKVCHERLKEAGIADSCELREGYIEDAPNEEFDALLSIVVGHFVPRDKRLSFYSNMRKRLKPGGHMVNTEISFDLDSPEYPLMLKNWQLARGVKSSEELSQQLKEILTVLPPEEVENTMRKSGFKLPVRFFQSFMVMGWYGVKE